MVDALVGKFLRLRFDRVKKRRPVATAEKFKPEKEDGSRQKRQDKQQTVAARLSAILSQIDGAGTVNAVITEEEGVPVSAVIFFDGADGILTRLRLTQAAAASLNIAENRVLVCPSDTQK